MSWRWTLIDELSRPDHFHLEPDDTCLFFREYTSGGGYDGGDANQLITNLKIKPSFRNSNRYKYKLRDIAECGRYFREGINHDWLRRATLIPIPPSKAKDHPEYDDRMLQVLLRIGIDGLDIRELLYSRTSMRASHESDVRLTIAEIVENTAIDETLTAPEPSTIVIVDDMLTAGSHFKATQQILATRFPNADIVGLFITRRVFASATDVEAI